MSKAKNSQLKLAKKRVLHHMLAKRLRYTDYTSTLPDEMLIHILSYLNQEELYFSARGVCKRWYSLVSTPTLWKSIKARSNISTNMLCQWIEHSPLLRNISLHHRKDMNTIVNTLALNSSNLEYVIARNCWGSPNSSVIRGNFLCRMIKNCPKLRNFGFVDSCIRSSKFFALIRQRGCRYLNILGTGKSKTSRRVIIITP